MGDCWRCSGKGWYAVARLDANAQWVSARKSCKCCTMKPEDYTKEYVLSHPISARCKKCKALWIDGNGNGAIRAPGLGGCACFYCHGELVEIEVGQPVSVEPIQPSLFA